MATSTRSRSTTTTRRNSWSTRPSNGSHWSRPEIAGLDVLRIGSAEQPVLKKKGDDLRIDWGYLYLAVPKSQAAVTVVADHEASRRSFAQRGRLPAADDAPVPRAANDRWPVTACAFDLGKIGKRQVCRQLILAYDDEFSIEYLGQKLRPWWRRDGAGAAEMLLAAAKMHERRVTLGVCDDFDREIQRDLQGCRRGGLRRPLRHRLPRGDRGPQAGRRAERRADALSQGEFFQRLHRHRGRAVPGGPDFRLVQQQVAEGHRYSGLRVRHDRSVEVSPSPRTT